MLGLNYTYVSLTPEQVATRRLALDNAGLQAYLLPITLLASVCFYRARHHDSPTTIKTSRNHKPTRPQTWARRLHWFVTTTAIGDLGPLNVVLVMLVYSTILIYIIFRNTGNDYMHLTKSLSHVTVAQLPLHYLLSIKSPRSPITVATGLTHERLNDYHRLFGRIIHILLAAHAVMYLKFFVDLDILSKRIRHWDVRTGLLAFTTVNLLGTFSLPSVRRVVYHRLFYRSHIVLSALILLVAWLHVPYTRMYIAQAAIFWILNGILRQKDSVDVDVVCQHAGPNLLTVMMVVPDTRLDQYTPGMHVYLNSKQWLGPRTPFTILQTTPLGHGTVEIKLVVKISGGPQTILLAKAAGVNSSGSSSSTSSTEKIGMQLEGPYGESSIYFSHLLSVLDLNDGPILFVCGGVGATYGLSIWSALFRHQQQRNKATSNLSFIWLVHERSELQWADPLIRNTLSSTSKSEVDSNSSYSSSRATVSDCKFTIYITGPSVSSTASALAALAPQIRIENHATRPDFSHLLAPYFPAPTPKHISSIDTNGREHSDGNGNGDGNTASPVQPSKLTILTCGPRSLTQTLKHALDQKISTLGPDRDSYIDFYEEQFGFGG